MAKSIAVVGAGVTGAVCSNGLAARGFQVQVFDKGRGPGGRTSSRRTETGHRFDHGAAEFVTANDHFHAFLAPAVTSGVLIRDNDRYFSANGLNALAKSLLAGLSPNYAVQLASIRQDGGWTLSDDAGKTYGPFDQVVLAVPPVNASGIVSGFSSELASTISAVQMRPRWVAMLGYADKQIDVPDRAEIDGHVVRRSRSNTVGDALVIESSADWSLRNVELDAKNVAPLLVEAVRPALGGGQPISLAAHRWRYAFADAPLGQPFLSSGTGLYVCGDWCLGQSIESAWQSATAVVDAIAV